jgi:multicomponent Na+:H+ antiporter subunit D
MISEYFFISIFIPLLASALCLFLRGNKKAERTITVLLPFIYMIFALFLLVTFQLNQEIAAGGWPSGIGIKLKFDILSALMLAVIGIIYFAGALYGIRGKTVENHRNYLFLYHSLFLGLTGAFLTQDLFNLFVWFEITLMSSYVLVALGEDKERLRSALKYIILNFFSGLLFLTTVGLIYSATKTLDFAVLKVRLAELYITDPGHVRALAFSLFSAFAIKSAFFPLFFWLPESYPKLSPGLSGVLAGLLTKLGLYAMIRMFSQVFPADQIFFMTVLILSVVTMLIGVWGAVIQTHIRKILSYHIISQVGFIGIAVSFSVHPDPNISSFARGAALFYIIHHIIVKTNLFFVSGLISLKKGTEEIESLGGLFRKYPIIAIMFLIPAGSLIGVPPLSGFWAKLSLFKVSIEARYIWVVFAMMIASFFTLYSMLKIWSAVFWGTENENENESSPISKSSYMAVTLLCIVTLAISFMPSWLYQLSLQIGD